MGEEEKGGWGGTEGREVKKSREGGEEQKGGWRRIVSVVGGRVGRMGRKRTECNGGERRKAKESGEVEFQLRINKCCVVQQERSADCTNFTDSIIRTDSGK